MGLFDRFEEIVERAVAKVMEKKLVSLLHDVDYRIKTIYESAGHALGYDAKYGSMDLNLPWHLIEGYTFTNNSPSPGYISWADVHIVYKGNTYAIEDGNTNMKYICWFLSTPYEFTTGDAKPDLTQDDVLVAINDSGIARLMIAPGKMVHGSAITNGSINAAELANGAVIADKIGALAIIEEKIADEAVTTNKIANNAVNNNKLADGAVVTTKIAANAVDSTKLADGAVISTKIADNAVTTSKIGDNQITGPKIGAGSIAEDKLNLATHFIF